MADAAVLCATKRDVDHYLQMLKARGLPVLTSMTYDGRPGQVLKVGTYLRAKGLEFKYVYLPCHDRGLKAAQLGGSADIDRLALARRQLFVAMTRARDLLWLGADHRRRSRHR
ncbi:3'-5' exonuclease [Salinispora arenicola]|uniref:3'-5' exonuclease n=1 Tax=Salinispora arenicola TaxID=168697 RepID=UPI003CC73A61